MPWVRTKIAQYRIDAGFKSAADAAKVLKCSVIHLREIERGGSGAGDQLVVRIAATYKRSQTDIRKAIEAARLAHLTAAIKSIRSA